MEQVMRLLLRLTMAIVAGSLLAACGGGGGAPTLSSTTPTRENTAAPGTALEHASAPAEGDFREDSYTWVAATGRPQLIEVFSYD